SVFTTTSEDVECRQVFHRFAKTDSMKYVLLPLTRDYTSLSDHTDLDESQLSYGTKSSLSCDPNCVPKDFVSCIDSDKSSKVNTNDLASNDSSLKSSEHKPTDSSCASTSSETPFSAIEDEGIFDSGCSRSMTGNKERLDDFHEFHGGKVTFRGGKGRITGKGTIRTPTLDFENETPFSATEDEGIFDSGCSRSMTGNKERLDDFHVFHGGKVTFGGGEGRITGKGTISTPTLDFENVYHVKELQKFNLFSISQICDKKNQVRFTNTECLVLSKDFQLPDDSMVVLKTVDLMEMQKQTIVATSSTEVEYVDAATCCGQ
nr:ribonuclease H-like domain-containing protein [Tanacetum cinerariifolium]